ncbi:MAG: phosphatidylglycerophosphatase A [Candidatus Acidiferrales bacterium]
MTPPSANSPSDSPDAANEPGSTARIASPNPRKPRFALFIATVAGLGYLPKAPGTFGSLAGMVLVVLPWWIFYAVNAASGFALGLGPVRFHRSSVALDPFLFVQLLLLVFTAAIGVWAAGRAAFHWRLHDPQKVVIDEVSGQHLTYVLGLMLPVLASGHPIAWKSFPLGLVSWEAPLNWKYLLAGLILFRAFDIWKPFPARQAESLPGGWGIMADDWIAGIYAALVLWALRWAGL